MSHPSILEELNAGQRAAATASGSAFVNAGPGTGKTLTGVGRVGWRVAVCGYSPRQVLALTFTRRAAGQFRERLELMLGPELAGQIRVATFHSFALAAVETAHQLTTGERVRLVSRERRRELLEELVRQALRKNQSRSKGQNSNPTTLAREIGEEIGRLRNRGVGPDNLTGAVLTGSSHPALLAEIYPRYLAELALAGLVELDGLVPEAAGWLEKLPVLARTLGVREALLDETQDTSPAQLDLLLALFKASRRELGVEPTLVGVGDSRQQIFAYLNASPYARLYQAFPGAQKLVLDQQYRFGPTLTGVANRISWHLGFDRPLRSTRQSDDPQGHFASLLENCGIPDSHLPVLVYRAGDEREEAEFIAEEINRIRECEPGAQVAVLARTRAGCRFLAGVLTQAGLPCFSPRLEEEGDNPTPTGNTITLSTIHASKGAEFEVVFVTGLASGLFPVNESHLLEELRLFFVAVTRARYLCYLTHPACHTKTGKLQETGPSWFLEMAG